MNDTTVATEALGHVIYFIDRILPVVRVHIMLIVAALLPIYAGAHASLYRPVSAAKPPKSKAKNDSATGKLKEEETNTLQGLAMSDVVLYPIMAGSMLASLYMLITYLEEAAIAILTSGLNAYMSVFGLIGVYTCLSDTVDIVMSFILPSRYLEDGRIWIVDGERRLTMPAKMSKEDQHPGVRTSPWPWSLARSSLPDGLLWWVRDLAFRPALIIKTQILTLNVNFQPTALRLVCAQITLLALGYYNLVDRVWWLTNLLGFSFCYSAFHVLSPTNFVIGTLLLSLLLVYDIYMVFFTPMMITVATKLDIPAKMMIPNPDGIGARAFAMLGLGDIVIPGIMMALALRFDLYMFYIRKQRLVPAEAIAQAGKAGTAAEQMAGQIEAPTNSDKATDQDEEKEVRSEAPTSKTSNDTPASKTYAKAIYQKVTGTWGDRYWLSGGNASMSEIHGGSFPKPYFYASVAGYLLGMAVTMIVLQIFQHGQPALLYLVPGVLCSIWLTAAVRGEVGVMCKYTEDADEGRAAKIDSAEILGEKHRLAEAQREVSMAAIEGRIEREKLENGEKGAVDLQKPSEDDENRAGDESKETASTTSKKEPPISADPSESETGAKTNSEEQTSDALNKERRIFQLSISIPAPSAHRLQQLKQQKQKQQQQVEDKQKADTTPTTSEKHDDTSATSRASAKALENGNSTVDWADGEPLEKRRRIVS